MTGKLVQLGASFCWTIARILVREAAWMTVNTVKERHKARQNYMGHGAKPRTVQIPYVNVDRHMVEYSLDGPAGYRPHQKIQESEEIS